MQVRTNPWTVAAIILGVGLLFGIGFIGADALFFSPTSCEMGQATGPQTSFVVSSTPSTTGVRVNITTVGPAIDADVLYVQTTRMNTTVAQLSTRYNRSATIDTFESIYLSNMSNGTHVTVRWLNRSFENPYECQDYEPPTSRVLTTFVVGNKSTYPTELPEWEQLDQNTTSYASPDGH